MNRFNQEEKDILSKLGFDTTKDILSKGELQMIESKLSEMYTMYGFDDDETQTELGEIYETMLNKLN